MLPVTVHTAGYSTQIVHSGLRSLRTGIYGTPDIYSYSSGYQEVLIPAGASGATLSFWWYPISAEGPMAVAAGGAPDPALVQAVVAGTLPAGVLAGDVQYVVLVDPPSGDILQTLLWTRSNAQTWQTDQLRGISGADRTHRARAVRHLQRWQRPEQQHVRR